MAQFNLGKVLSTHEGDWDTTVTYEHPAYVRHDNALWVSTRDSTGATPSDSAVSWSLVARDGADGADGGGGGGTAFTILTPPSGSFAVAVGEIYRVFDRYLYLVTVASSSRTESDLFTDCVFGTGANNTTFGFTSNVIGHNPVTHRITDTNTNPSGVYPGDYFLDQRTSNDVMYLYRGGHTIRGGTFSTTQDRYPEYLIRLTSEVISEDLSGINASGELIIETV